MQSQFQVTSPLNSHAVGMDVAWPLGFEIDFVRNPISGSAAWFFVIILKLFFTTIFEIKVHEKNPMNLMLKIMRQNNSEQADENKDLQLKNNRWSTVWGYFSE